MTDKTYFCPMHAQVKTTEASDCPICGMSLAEQPGSICTDDLDQSLVKELKFLKERFVVSLVFLVPLVLLSMLAMAGPSCQPGAEHHFLSKQKLLELAQLLLATPVVFWCGAIFLKRAADSFKHRSANMFTLIALGVLAAYLTSSFLVLADLFLPKAILAHNAQYLAFQHRGTIKLYFESAAAIITLTLLGQILELKARQSSGLSISSLLSSVPKVARKINDDGSESEAPLQEILVGDRLRVRVGEQIPIDGILENGSASVDESLLSGEAIPVEKSVGDRLSAGTTNGISTFIMRCTRRAEDSTLATIIRTVQESQSKRMPVQDLADQVSSVFVPLVILIAIISFLVWSIILKDLNLAVSSAIAVLIVACPCALGLATPTAILVATGIGANNGILIIDPKAIQILEKIDLLAVDKTGTLTEGKPTITKVIAGSSFAEEDILRWAASLEQGSEHPFAKSILQKAQENKIDLLPVTQFQYKPAQGIKGKIGDNEFCLGSIRFIEHEGIDLKVLQEQLSDQDLRQGTVLGLTVNQQAAGLLIAQDRIKKTCRLALDQLSNQKIVVVMLTGDQQQRAAAIAQDLNLTQFHAQLLPEDKAKLIDNFRKQGYVVCMAGDGINDAPALAQANVGIAMGDGSGIAAAAADIVLFKGDLLALIGTFRLGKAMMRTIRQNLIFAFAYNIFAIPVASGLLIPIFKVALDPAIAAAAMSISSLAVVGNSLRLQAIKLQNTAS